MNEEEFFNRAINRICKDYDYNFANEFKLLFLKKDKEIERLNNIIKEAKEYIEERYNGEVLTHTFDKDNVGELLEILDKEVN